MQGWADVGSSRGVVQRLKFSMTSTFQEASPERREAVLVPRLSIPVILDNLSQTRATS